jgi:hypothetical protein
MFVDDLDRLTQFFEYWAVAGPLTVWWRKRVIHYLAPIPHLEYYPAGAIG